MAEKQTPAAYEAGKAARAPVAGALRRTKDAVLNAVGATLPVGMTIPIARALPRPDVGSFFEGLLGMSSGGMARADAPGVTTKAVAPVVQAEPTREDAYATPQDLALAQISAILGSKDASHRRKMDAIGGFAQVSPKPLSPEQSSGAVADAIGSQMLNAELAGVSKQLSDKRIDAPEAQKASDAALARYLAHRQMIWKPPASGMWPMLPQQTED